MLHALSGLSCRRICLFSRKRTKAPSCVAAGKSETACKAAAVWLLSSGRSSPDIQTKVVEPQNHQVHPAPLNIKAWAFWPCPQVHVLCTAPGHPKYTERTQDRQSTLGIKKADNSKLRGGKSPWTCGNKRLCFDHTMFVGFSSCVTPKAQA